MAAATVMLGAGRARWPERGFRSYTSFLIVDATPSEARVFVDDRLLGSAGRVVACAFPVAPGPPVVRILAPGLTRYVGRFIADPGFATRIRVALR